MAFIVMEFFQRLNHINSMEPEEKQLYKITSVFFFLGLIFAQDIPTEAVAFTVFVANHKSQLDFYGIPQALWRVS